MKQAFYVKILLPLQKQKCYQDPCRPLWTAQFSRVERRKLDEMPISIGYERVLHMK
jgi:hypothetical protein